MKKDHILRCIDLGMDFYRSCVCSACTEEEIDLLNKDEEFQKEIKERYALQEYNFLMKHNVALEVAKNKGNSKPIEWRLGILNPKKYFPTCEIATKTKLIPPYNKVFNFVMYARIKKIEPTAMTIPK